MTKLFQLLFIIFALAHYAYADDFQDLDSIKQSVYEFADKQLSQTSPDAEITISVGHLDSRLHLSQCQRPLNLRVPSGATISQTNIIAVSCEGAKPWRIYVPIKVKISKLVPVTAGAMAKGVTISADDIMLEARDVATLRKSIYLNQAQIVGKVTKHPMMAGAVYKPGDLQAAKVISKGETVIILAHKGGLKVSMQGIALAGGGLGDHISVRNTRSKRVVDGVITDPGIIEIVMR